MIVSNLKTFPINIMFINLLLCLAQICHSFDNDFTNQHVISMEDEASMKEGSSQIQNQLNNMKLLESNQNENFKIPSSRGMSSSRRMSLSLEDPNILKTWGKLQIRPALVRFSNSKPQSLPDINASKRRNKRRSSSLSFFNEEIVHDVCPSVSDWVAIDESIDPYGNPVNVAQRINVNGTMVNQYFYETFCASKKQQQYDEMSNQYENYYNDEQECKGIDKNVRSFRFITIISIQSIIQLK